MQPAGRQSNRPVVTLQGAQCSDQLATSAEDAAGAIERFEGMAAPANGSVQVRQGAEPPDFAALLQLPPSFQPEPCSAYDADFAVSCSIAAYARKPVQSAPGCWNQLFVPCQHFNELQGYSGSTAVDVVAICCS